MDVRVDHHGNKLFVKLINYFNQLKSLVMRKLLLLITVILLSGCYTVSQVGNCKYYTPKFKSSYYKQHKPIGF